MTDPHLADDIFLEYMRVINPDGTVRGTLAGGDLPVWLGGFVHVVVNY